MIRVVVSGAAGRMGEAVCEAVEGADDLELAGRADPALGTELATLLADADVVVDFTAPETALENVRACVDAGVHAVVGTTGFDLDAAAGGRRGRRRGERLRRPELRDRRGADDALRRRGGHAHARGRDRRAPPRPQARRAVGDREADRGADPRGGRQRPRADPLRAPARPGRPPGGAARRRRPDPLDPPRLDRPALVHARGAARGAPGRRARTARSTVGLETLL